MKALVVDAPRVAEIREVPTPIPAGNQILIKVCRAGICGTDNAIYTGECSFVRDGSIQYPVRLGHEWSGVVAAVGEGVKNFKPGDRVIADNGVSCGHCPACLGGDYGACQSVRSVGTVNCWDGCFAEYMLMPEYHVYHLSDAISLDMAALIEPVSIAYDCFKQRPLGPGSFVAVIGTGPIGMSAVALARHYGAGRVAMVGRRDNKLDIARQVGATDLINNTRENAVERIRVLTGGRGADLIIEASGDERSLIDAMHSAAVGGHISVVAFYDRPINGIPIDRLVLSTITIKGAAGCYGNAEAVLNIMGRHDLHLGPLITHRVKFADCLKFFEHDADYRADKVKVMVEFD